MRSLSGWLMPVAVAVLGGSALAPVVAAAAPASPGVRCERRVELLAPQAAIPLAAGSTAVLEWEPLAGLAALPAREEWEAFLSLDGGRTYSVRITPHLDSDLRRTLWEVPGVPSADVRLLLRFGNERRETVIELPQRFTIAATPAPILGSLLPPAALAPRRGEAARPGDQGVVAWTDGSRRGLRQRRMVAASDAALHGGLRQPEPGRVPVALTVRPAKTGPPAPARAAAHDPAPRGAAVAPVRSRQDPPPPIDTILQTSRLNE
ncbi:MAG TPA: hypothetical protein VN999_02805 [Thermoanaerobaculia bacterium]|nr:hypothetical protein [Thermoanaerobaculia bacterium]